MYTGEDFRKPPSITLNGKVNGILKIYDESGKITLAIAYKDGEEVKQ
jgi:antitoxin component YwqK of YwqJK toxin-antitoxin module